MEFNHFVGYTGIITYIAAYGLAKYTSYDAAKYTAARFAAAALTLYSLAFEFTITPLPLQIALATLSVTCLLIGMIYNRPIRLSPMEKTVAQSLFPTLSNRRALEVINSGVWQTDSDRLLAHEGQPFDHIAILLTGSAEVIKSGTRISKIRAGQIIGRNATQKHKTATANIRLGDAAHYFTIPAKTLRTLLDQNADIAAAFKQGVLNSTLTPRNA
ncbi:hypothetical protein GCM10007939_19640 [Amylibacter marinus]|uniref:Cyclic nucleotide-binding domain-containing protein n=1 Tax=Amylibacter marinus TaxID=1475483 RepID=A0ABQ5VXA0_9RHOB|nr:cyclic nucleotide-binding domain-containing protein [Amylibacter marinus]GLQ35681.1 hypothetical protein GCM10007939_19640 [Amylibacter marinus]